MSCAYERKGFDGSAAGACFSLDEISSAVCYTESYLSQLKLLQSFKLNTENKSIDNVYLGGNC